jgi:hypothetical protein
MVDCLSEEWTDGWQRTEILFQEEHPGGKEGIMIKTRVDLLSIVIIMMLGICSLLGILSMDFTKSFDVVNQYGDTVAIFGSGIYSGDTYFKAPILIGTDFCILFVVVPLFIQFLTKKKKGNSNINRLNLMALYAVAFYYSASIAFGVKYNQLHLVYIALFGCTLFGMFKIFREIDLGKMNYPLTKGLKVYLVVIGIALIVAWLPDIIPTIFSGRPLQLIGVYTTEITYVLDMGIIAPLCLICLHMLGKKDPIGIVALAAILKLCIIIGIMMIPQPVPAGIRQPLPGHSRSSPFQTPGF